MKQLCRLCSLSREPIVLSDHKPVSVAQSGHAIKFPPNRPSQRPWAIRNLARCTESATWR